MGDDDYNWNNLPTEIVILIGQRLNFTEYYVRFTAVCKSWKAAMEEVQKPLLPPRLPWLFLAEEVAPGGILAYGAFDDNDIDDNDNNSDNDVDNNDGEGEDDQNDDEDEDDNDDDPVSKYLSDMGSRYDHRNNSIGTTRGLYSLSTGKTYNIELPEAAGRVILGANKGWLVTVGRDLQINLLHPLSRHQIPLPSMLAFPTYEYDGYDENYPLENDFDVFIHKLVLSSSVSTKNTDISSPNEYYETRPTVMAIFQCGDLGFARLGDKVWTDIANNIPRHYIVDIAYHKGNFYTVDCNGSIFVYDIDNDNKKGGYGGTEIASLNIIIYGQSNDIYLVETLSGSGLLLVVRTRRVKYVKPPHRMRSKYRTINFSLWKLELYYGDGQDIPSCTLTEENNLGNEAIFIGRTSSVSVSSSEIIKPNCIYFTDDNDEIYGHKGGGHDMGIFHIENRTIEPHFQGKSLHPISPPLWYI